MRTFLFTRPRGNSLYFLHGELLCQGGDFAFPAGCPRRPCPTDDLWVMISLCEGGVAAPSNRSPDMARPGWSVRQKKVALQTDHPVCAASVASRLLLIGAATPPLQ